MSGADWRWLWRGDLPAAAAAVEFVDAALALPEAMLAELAADWEVRLADAKRNGRRLFESPLATLLGHRATEAGLELRLGRSSYSHWLFSGGRQAEIESRFGPGVASRPLALCAAVITADGRVAIQERSAAVAEGAGLLHVVGGHLDPEAHRLAGRPDPEVAIRSELFEELGLGEGDLEDGRLLGFGENLANGKPELLYRYGTRLDEAALSERAEHARDRFEFARLRFVSMQDGSLGSLLGQPRDRFAAPGLALLGRLAELDDWA